jgi:hypothetical protein
MDKRLAQAWLNFCPQILQKTKLIDMKDAKKSDPAVFNQKLWSNLEKK